MIAIAFMVLKLNKTLNNVQRERTPEGALVSKTTKQAVRYGRAVFQASQYHR